MNDGPFYTETGLILSRLPEADRATLVQHFRERENAEIERATDMGRRLEREAILRYLEQAAGGSGEWYDGFRTAIMRMRNDIRAGEHAKRER